MGNHLTRGTAAEQRALRAAIRDTGLLTMEAAAVRIVAALHAAGERILPMAGPDPRDTATWGLIDAWDDEADTDADKLAALAPWIQQLTEIMTAVARPTDTRPALFEALTRIVGDIGPIDDESSRRTAAHMLRLAAGQPTDEPTDADPEQVARLFHETYERLAPSFGYETRKASAVPWDDVPDQNKRLMIAVAGEVRQALVGGRSAHIAGVDGPWRASSSNTVTIVAGGRHPITDEMYPFAMFHQGQPADLYMATVIARLLNTAEGGRSAAEPPEDEGDLRFHLEVETGMSARWFGAFAEAKDRATSLEAVVRDLVDADPCSFDHHGYCQAHAWLEDGECPHARAKALLADGVAAEPNEETTDGR